MRKQHLKYLICPKCKSNLILKIKTQEKCFIKEGTLECINCRNKYKIINYIPRFVPLNNYADSFSLEWTKHAKTQYDSYSGVKISEERFFNETNWPRKLNNQIILEVGCGSGRFTEIAASTEAMIISFDYSNAVEANYKSHGHKSNVLIVQANLYQMPFKQEFFDKLFCFGVLQHTPDPKKAILELPKYLRPHGSLVFNIYNKQPVKILFNTKYLIRPLTKHISPTRLYKLCKIYINLVWPITRAINKIPYLGRRLNWRLLVADYEGIFKLPKSMLKDWAILDTFDMLSPRYDFPQSIKTINNWLSKTSLINIDIFYNEHGIHGSGIKK